MTLLRRLLALLFLLGAMNSPAAEPPTAAAGASAPLPMSPERQRLEGTWKGVMVGQEKDGEITITIAGDSLHFYRDTNFWFRTTFELRTGTTPRQLQATIRACPPGQESSVGKVVPAIYKIEDQTLTLVAIDEGEEVTAQSFEIADAKGSARYRLRKVPPKVHPTEPSQPR